MSKTISFVASDELAEYLEREAEKRMTTVSSTAQMLLAEYARMQRTKPRDFPDDAKTDRERMEELGITESEGDVFDRHPEQWYRPNSEKHDFAVEVPEDASNYDAGKTRYYKTRSGAAEALRRWYE
jgi:predicted transcriptional regulator